MSNIGRSCQLLCFGVPGIVSVFFVLLPGPGDQKNYWKKEIRESAIHGLSTDERFGALGIHLPELTGVRFSEGYQRVMLGMKVPRMRPIFSTGLPHSPRQRRFSQFVWDLTIQNLILCHVNCRLLAQDVTIMDLSIHTQKRRRKNKMVWLDDFFRLIVWDILKRCPEWQYLHVRSSQMVPREPCHGRIAIDSPWMLCAPKWP